MGTREADTSFELGVLGVLIYFNTALQDTLYCAFSMVVFFCGGLLPPRTPMVLQEQV